MSIITVPKSLREKLGEEGSDALVEMFNQAQAGQKNDIIEIVAEKFERLLTEEISGLRAELKEDIASLDTNMHAIRAELIEKMSTSHADLIKWMFIFWVGQVVTILGILFVFFG